MPWKDKNKLIQYRLDNAEHVRDTANEYSYRNRRRMSKYIRVTESCPICEKKGYIYDKLMRNDKTGYIAPHARRTVEHRESILGREHGDKGPWQKYLRTCYLGLVPVTDVHLM